MSDQKIILTDAEWMALLRSTEDSELPPCCANISALRDEIIDLATERSDISWAKTGLLRAYGAARDGHDLDNGSFPVLDKLMQQVDAFGGLTRADLPPVHQRFHREHTKLGNQRLSDRAP